MSRHYVLDAEGRPCEEPDLLTWARWYERSEWGRLVARTSVRGGGWVSTVFLGLDHGAGEGPPVLWETMAFDTTDGEKHQRRYTSRERAVRGHAQVVAELGGAA